MNEQPKYMLRDTWVWKYFEPSDLLPRRMMNDMLNVRDLEWWFPTATAQEIRERQDWLRSEIWRRSGKAYEYKHTKRISIRG